MIMKPLVKVLIAAGLWAVASSVSAVSILADPDDVVISPGEQVILTIEGDFQDDPTLGGGLDFDWDPTVIDLISFDPVDWGGDPDFFNAGVVNAEAGSISGFAAGNFNGVTGPVTMATITFVGVGPGRSLTMSDDSDGKTGPFVSEATFDIQNPDFGPNNAAGLITVVPVVVPVPAAIWMMLSGIGALIGLSGLRRKV